MPKKERKPVTYPDVTITHRQALIAERAIGLITGTPAMEAILEYDIEEFTGGEALTENELEELIDALRGE